MTWHTKLSRYAMVGVLSNAAGYLLYLLLTTYAGVEHKSSMSLLFAVCLAASFYCNRTWPSCIVALSPRRS